MTHAIIRLFDREYWKRCWIIQEIYLAKQVTLHCGSDSILRRDLHRVSELLEEDAIFISEAFFKTEIGHLMWCLFSLGFNTFDDVGNSKGGSAVTLGGKLIRHRLQKATDPRDKVYSLLGLLLPDTRQQIVIDYLLEPSVLFQNVATFIATKESGLRILAENKPPSDFKLPSWVPNWANCNQADQMRIDGVRINNKGAEIGWKAASSQPSVQPYIRSTKILCVQGTLVGRVTAAGPLMLDFVDEEFNFVPVFDTLYEWWLIFLAAGRKDIVGPRGLVDIVTFGDYYREDSEMDPETSKIFEQEAFESIMLALQLYKPWDKTLLPTAAKRESPIEDAEKRQAETQIWNVAPGGRKRRFIVIDGNVCGLGPQCVEIGDFAVVVPGSRVPLIFRKRSEGDGYFNIGDAYIEDFMTGKAVNDVEEGTRHFEDFDLH